eukprot:789138-Rhodomonas_salina.2
MRCPILLYRVGLRACYAMSGTDIPYMLLPGTGILTLRSLTSRSAPLSAYGSLRACLTTSSTDRAYLPTRSPLRTHPTPLRNLRYRPCVRRATCLRTCYAVSVTDLVYHATNKLATRCPANGLQLAGHGVVIRAFLNFLVAPYARAMPCPVLRQHMVVSAYARATPSPDNYFGNGLHIITSDEYLVCSYLRATRCPVLTQRLVRTDITCGSVCVRACYAMSSTAIACGPIHLRACYTPKSNIRNRNFSTICTRNAASQNQNRKKKGAISLCYAASSTDIAYGGVLARRCPVLTQLCVVE